MPLRVLLLAENPYVGGITSHLLGVLEAFRGDPAVELIPATFPGWYDDHTFPRQAALRGFHVHTMPMTWRFDPTVLRAFRRFLEEYRIDLIHTHGYRGAVVGALAAGRVPVISTCHGELVAPAWRSRVWEWLTLKAMKRHPRVIACADYVRTWLVGRGLDPERVVTIHNSTRIPASGDSPVTRAALGIADDALVLLFVGRLVAGKGIEHLLRAVAVPGTVLVVVGDGPLRVTLEGLAKSLGVKAYFAGRQEETGDFYRLADVVALPSELEAMPMVLLEAAACGKPAVATRVGGIPEVVVDEETGILIDCGHVEQLRAAIERCRDAALRTRLGAQAHARWAREFSPEIMAAALKAVYLESVSQRPRHSI